MKEHLKGEIVCAHSFANAHIQPFLDGYEGMNHKCIKIY